MNRSRSWCYTLNNYSLAEFDEVVKLEFKYHCCGKEVGEGGTPHLQGYIYTDVQRSLAYMKKLIVRAHWEIAKGSHQQASDYCKKDKNFIETGVLPSSGKRTDIIKATEDIKLGKSVDQIAVEDPLMFHMYGRTLQKIEDITLRSKFRNWTTLGFWYWGKTGVGKSHEAFKDFTPKTHYVLPNDSGWWDGYTGQETVIMNDFRASDMPYGFLLQLVDKWPVTVKRRSREPVPFLAKKLIVTCSMPPEEAYSGIAERHDSIDQLRRRFTIKEVVAQRCSEGNTKPLRRHKKQEVSLIE